VLSAAHLPAYEFAQEVVRLLVEPEAQDGQRRRIVAVYLDPSNFKDIGDGTATMLSPSSFYLLSSHTVPQSGIPPRKAVP
jgi:hypothetical protein